MSQVHHFVTKMRDVIPRVGVHKRYASTDVLRFGDSYVGMSPRFSKALVNLPGVAGKFAIGGMLWGLGDLLAQKVAPEEAPRKAADLEKERKTFIRKASARVVPDTSLLGKWNSTSTMNAFIIGALVFSPLGNAWYTRADKIVPLIAKRVPGMNALVDTPARANMMKVVLDQTLFAPVILTCVFTSFGLLNGKKIGPAVDSAMGSVGEAIVPNWALWGPVQMLNFAVVPPAGRLLLVNSVNVPWTAYLAYKSKNAA